LFTLNCSRFFSCVFFFFSSRRRHTRSTRDWSSDVCSSDLSAITIFSGLSTIRIVLNPEKMVIAESQRLYTYLSLFGFPVDAVVEIGRASCRERGERGGGVGVCEEEVVVGAERVGVGRRHVE